MPKTVKLSSADARAWRENRSQWVSPKGLVLRAVTAEEEKAIFPAIEAAKRIKRDGKQNVVAEYRVQDEHGERVQQMPMEVVLRITKTGRDQSNFVVNAYVGGNRYVTGRAILEARILAKHGECILQGTNGKQITVIRDPRLIRPSFSDSQRSAPAPANCHCRGFKDNPHPDRHHVVCEWNGKAPAHERALPVERTFTPSLIDSPEAIESLAFGVPALPAGLPTTPGAARAALTPRVALVPGQLGARVLSGPAPQHLYARPPLPPTEILATPTVAHTPRPVAPVAHSPLECPANCRGFSDGSTGWPWPPERKPREDEHHPFCPHAMAWDRKVQPAAQFLILDLQTNRAQRPATPAEVAESQINQKRLGVATVTINGGIYAVVPAAGAEPAGEKMQRTIERLPTVPTQAELRTLPEGVRTTAVPIPDRRALVSKPAYEMSEDELEAVLAQRRALRESQLPALPSTPFEVESEVSEETAPLEVPLEAELVDYSEVTPSLPTLAAARVVYPTTVDATGQVPPALLVQEDPTLRNQNGLVGLQQKPSDIEQGPVDLLPLPEAFQDPMAQKASPSVHSSPPPLPPSAEEAHAVDGEVAA